jgi:hypothetical protein
MKIEQLQPGQVVYKAIRRRMGNTKMWTTGIQSIKILEVTPDGKSVKYVVEGWKRWTSKVGSWHLAPPPLIKTNLVGQKRLATRAEIKEMKAKKAEEDARLMQAIFPEKSAVTVEPVTREEALRRMDEEGM